MADFAIGQGDRRPVLTAQLLENGVGIDLSSASGVTVKGVRADGTTGWSGACTIVTASTGNVSYSWAAGDTDEPGDYRVTFVIDWGSSIHQTIPTARTSIVRVAANTTADS